MTRQALLALVLNSTPYFSFPQRLAGFPLTFSHRKEFLMKKLAIVLLGMLAAVSSFAVFYLPLTTEPIENAILPTIVAAAVGLASGAIIGRLSGPASSDQRAPAATPTYRRRNT